MKSRLCRITVLTLVGAFGGCGGGPTQPPPTMPVISTASLPNGTLETPYSQTIQASGGVAPFNWTVSAGTLPHNVALKPSVTNTVTLSGTPDTAVQSLAFTIKVTDSASQSAAQPYKVSVLLEPDTLTLTPPSLSFAPQLVGTLSAVQPETVTNTGSVPVLINSVALAGTNAAEFGQNHNCGSSLAAGANCVINVSVTPSQIGPSSASITIADSTVGSPHSVALSGVGLTAGSDATLSATSLTLPLTTVGTTSAARSITLTNYGTTALNISSIAVTAVPADFGKSDNCGSSLASAASCTINVTFTPLAMGTVTGTLSVNDNAPGNPQTVPLSGTGTTSTFTGRCLIDAIITQCQVKTDVINCPVGAPAQFTGGVSCVNPPNTYSVDSSQACGSSGNGGCASSTSGEPPARLPALGYRTHAEYGEPQRVSASSLNVTASGAFYNATVSCSVQPSPALDPTCSISPGSIMPGTAATLTVRTTAPTPAVMSSSAGSGLLYALCLPLIGLVVCRIGPGKMRKRKLTTAALVGMLFAGLVFQIACGGSSTTTTGSPGTPKGRYTITVTATYATGSLKHSTPTMLTVQ